MTNTLFLQSEIQDPYKLYEMMLSEGPVFWDAPNNLWAIYSYKYCKSILSNPAAQIPIINDTAKNAHNEHAFAIISKLVRISNGDQHEIARYTAMLLFENAKTASVRNILDFLIQKKNGYLQIDWVNAVCKKLPVIVLLKNFEFSNEENDFISSHIEQLAQLMLPSKTPEQVTMVNWISTEIYKITEKRIFNTKLFNAISNALYEKYKLKPDEILSFCVSNLIGLLIQSYDACRGLLSNALLQILNLYNNGHRNFSDKRFLQDSITETLRFDPPVHNTRRVATADINFDDHKIKNGQQILLVLASANRDPLQFKDAHLLNLKRINNAEHLTFGIGGHMCLARHFSINMATEALSYLFEKYKMINVADNDIKYEPRINVRLPKNILISLT